MADDRSRKAAIFRFACLGFVGFADARLIADLDFRDERKRECDGKFKLARTGQFRDLPVDKLAQAASGLLAKCDECFHGACPPESGCAQSRSSNTAVADARTACGRNGA